MGNIVLAAQNAVDAVATIYGNADASFPLANLKDPVFAKIWRYTPAANPDGSVARFAFPFSAPMSLGHLALCRHNLSEGAQIRVRASLARFDADFTTDSPFTHDITFGGGVNGTRTNEYGVLVSNGCPRYEHDRRFYENGFLWSEDLMQAVWTEANGATRISSDTVTFESAGAQLYQNVGEIYAGVYEIRAQIRVVDGNGDFKFDTTASTSATAAVATATRDWQWFTGTFSVSAYAALNTLFVVTKQTAGGTLRIRRLQVYRGTSGGKYRKTTSTKRYQRIGLITEVGMTNDVLHSADMTQAVWSKAALTVTANTAFAPDGTLAMDRVNFNAGGGTLFQQVNIPGATARALSVVFRKDSSTSAVANLFIQWSGGVTQKVQLNFNPSTAAVVSTAITAGAQLKASGIKDLGNGFYRAYIMGAATDAAQTALQVGIQTLDAAASTVTVWGMQGESSYVTSYIPTGAAAVARTVDTAVVEAASWTPYVWRNSEATLYHEAMLDSIGADGGRAASYVFAGTSPNGIFSYIFYSSSTTGTASFESYTGGVRNYRATDTAIGTGVVSRNAIRARPGDYIQSINGTTVGVSVGTQPPALPAVTAINLMAASDATAYLRRVTIWPTGKSQADLNALTTSGPGAVEFDSGWDDALVSPMSGDVPAAWGLDYDILKTFPGRPVEWLRVELYDPAKTSGAATFDVGRLFAGRLVMQPLRNAEYGLEYGWRERTTSEEARDGRKFFDELPRPRVLAFTFPKLEPREARIVHELQGSAGTSQEVLVLTNPDDEADCQRLGGVGYLSKLDPLTFPSFPVRQVSVQWEKKR